MAQCQLTGLCRTMALWAAAALLLTRATARILLPVDISTGGDHSCAILDDGSTKCWGHNGDGHLGYGDRENRGDEPGEMGDALPVVDFGAGRRAVHLTAGAFHRCARLDNDVVKCWGKGESGQLGYGEMINHGHAPGEMGDALPAVDLGTGLYAKQLCGGDYHTCAVLNNGGLKCWGGGGEGQIGYGDSNDRGRKPGEMGDNLPFVDLGTNRTATAVSCGDYHTCVLLDNGWVKCFGDALQGQLGYGNYDRIGDHPNEMGDFLPPVPLGTGRKAVQITLGWYHSCALLDNNELKCWGYGGHGQLGTGDKTWRGTGPGQMGDNLTAVDLGTGRYAVEISAGSAFTCARMDNSEIKCWGQGHVGQLGVAHTEHIGDHPNEMGDFMKPVKLGTGLSATMISCGDLHSCAILNNGSAKCWGANHFGQLGLENNMTYGASDATLGDALPILDFGNWATTTTTSTSTNATLALATSDGTAATGVETPEAVASPNETVDVAPIPATTMAPGSAATAAVTDGTTVALSVGDATTGAPDANAPAGAPTSAGGGTTAGPVDAAGPSTSAAAADAGTASVPVDAAVPVATTAAPDSQATTVAPYAQVTTVVQDAQATTMAPDAQATTVAPDAQATTVAQDAQATTVALDAQATTVALDALATTVVPDAQAATVVPVAQATTVAPDAGLGTTMGPVADGSSITTPAAGLSPKATSVGDSPSVTSPSAPSPTATLQSAPAPAMTPLAMTSLAAPMATSTTVTTTTIAPAFVAIAKSTDGDLGFDYTTTPEGVLRVTSVQPDSWASSAGVQPGYEVHHIDGRSVAKMAPEEITTALNNTRPLSVHFLPTQATITATTTTPSKTTTVSTAVAAADGGTAAPYTSTTALGQGPTAPKGTVPAPNATGVQAPDAVANSTASAQTTTTQLLGAAPTVTTLAPVATATTQASATIQAPVTGPNATASATTTVAPNTTMMAPDVTTMAPSAATLVPNVTTVAEAADARVGASNSSTSTAVLNATLNGTDQGFNVSSTTLPTAPLDNDTYPATASISDGILGLVIQGRAPQPVTVLAVEKESWAGRAGVTIGDELVSLNGRLVAMMAPDEIIDALTSVRPLDFRFRRRPPVTTTRPSPSFANTYSANATEAERDMGIAFDGTAPGPIYVEAVEPGTWGERVGVTVGDELAFVNEVPVSSMSPADLSKVLVSRPVFLRFRKLDPVNDVPKLKDTYPANAFGVDKDLGITWDGSPPATVRVASVAAGSWAERAGVKVGDELAYVDVRQVADLTPEELKKMLANQRPLYMRFRSSPKASGPSASTTSGKKVLESTTTGAPTLPIWAEDLLVDAAPALSARLPAIVAVLVAALRRAP